MVFLLPSPTPPPLVWQKTIRNTFFFLRHPSLMNIFTKKIKNHENKFASQPVMLKGVDTVGKYQACNNYLRVTLESSCSHHQPTHVQIVYRDLSRNLCVALQLIILFLVHL